MDMAGASSVLLQSPFSLELTRAVKLKLLSSCNRAGCCREDSIKLSLRTKVKPVAQALPPGEQTSLLQTECAVDNSSPSSVSSPVSSSSSSELTRERGIAFATGSSFFRSQSSLGRDLAVLAAALYKKAQGQLRVIDAMSGCGVRALRYLIQSDADFALVNDCNPEIHNIILENLSRYIRKEGGQSLISEPVFETAEEGNSELQLDSNNLFGVRNHDDPSYHSRPGCFSRESQGRHPSLTDITAELEFPRKEETRNGGELEGQVQFRSLQNSRSTTVSLLAQHSFDKYAYCFPHDRQHDSDKILAPSNVRWQICHEEAARLFMKCNLNMDFYDFIDVDSFGSDSFFLGPALSALRFGGLLFVTCTDGFSSGGHRPDSSLAQYGTFMRPMPYSNELGLRMLMGAVSKEAALRNMSVSPVFSIYAPHGPVFRVLVRVTAGKPQKIMHYGFIYYCGKCGDSKTVDWEKLGSTCCPCSEKAGVWFSKGVWTPMDRTSPQYCRY
ncbi:hypothetical protein KP509_13G056200 [Ceratopteris richardii]|uniref:tRNA (guanine(26)-N(2))-dimethyltransferase n=1 Tax=Ceratopteris richardii TaxID=49495 RepID=A0A8T2TFZ1_CERRI|nr:hypothetical protein KP509_13G056200 [Ceratopteris richardii]